MRNRAKCKLCNDIIESFHSTDTVHCSCGKLFVWGGSAMGCAYDKIIDFVRVDDENNEVIVKEKLVENADISSPKPDREELLKMLDEMIKNIEGLPQQALSQPVTHYDLLSALLLLSSVFRADCSDDI